jgi:HAD superfamily hydrolase (TIGR01549 family)
MEDSIRAILFDLDGTLLSNDMNVFLPHYFGLLAAHVSPILPPERFMAHLMQAVEVMLANDGRATNEEVFAEAFYPLAGRSREEMEPLFVEFYETKFPSLEQYTQRKPEARQVVQLAFDLGYDVAIVTNPLFPATATEQRLAWAGVADFAYRLVTTYENSRAAKPNPLYFEQVLEALGHSPEASLVVGDEDMDMVAAHLGCRTFLVRGPRTELASSTPPPTYEGTLAEVGDLMQRWR